MTQQSRQQHQQPAHITLNAGIGLNKHTHNIRHWLLAAGATLSAALCAVVMVIILATPLRAQDATPAAQPTAAPVEESSAVQNSTNQSITLPLAPPAARAGAAFYAQNCAACHGETGAGDGPTAPSLPVPPTAFADANAVWARTPAQLFLVAKYGKIESLMPPWGNQMSDPEIWNTLAYAWSLHTSPQEVNTGAATYAATCADCHGAGGAGDGPQAEGALPDFTDQAYAIEHSQADWLAGWRAAHFDIGGDLNGDMQRAVLAYIRTFSLAPAWAEPQLTGDGAIGGVVAQGTAGGAAVAGLVATLDVWLGNERISTITTTVNASNTFSFTNLATDPSLIYIASVASEGVSYSSDLLALSPLAPTLQGNITVYETTSDPAALRVDRMNWIIETQAEALLMGQIYAVGNGGDRTWVGAPAAADEANRTFAMHIPQGAQELAFENGIVGGRFVQEGSIVYDTLPIAPGMGTRQIILRFLLPYTGTSALVEQELLYPTQQLNVFVGTLPGLEVDAPALVAEGEQELGGIAPYLAFAAAELPTRPITLALTGLLAEGDLDPRVGAVTQPGVDSGVALDTSQLAPPVASALLPDWMIYALAGVVGALLLGVLAWTAFSGAARRQAQDRAQQYEALLDHAARLDDLRALGELSESEWLAKRAQVKAQLLALRAQDESHPRPGM